MTGAGDAAPLYWGLDHPELRVGWILARDVRSASADAELQRALDDAVAARAEVGVDEATRSAIRDLLRGHGYKPAGRGKPASEFLVSAAGRGDFPRINNIVDINNLVSVETGWPASVFDLQRALDGGDGLELRLGRTGEKFIFNPAGQSIDIGGLICVARIGGEAIGNPVKDSVGTKIVERTRDLLAVIYTSRTLATRSALATVAERYARLLQRHAGARSTSTGLLPL